MDAIVWLATKPLALAAAVLLAGVRSVSLATLAWWHLVRGIVSFHVRLCWRALAWFIALVSLPARLLSALHRETELEIQLLELQRQLESFTWENKELEERLKKVTKDRKVMETIFEEIEDEHEKALIRIDQLESELKDLKEDTLRLNEIRGKGLWNYGNDDVGVQEGIPVGRSYGVPSWDPGFRSGKILRDTPMPWSDVDKIKPEEHPMSKPLTPYQPADLRSSMSSVAVEVLERQRVVALSRSLFSSMMSLIVGMIIWEADDPCVPLVSALFIVVGMSLHSVVQFFSTVKNKPASDAVALLSVNWFILGTITSPSLPVVARVLTPRVFRLFDRSVVWLWLGFSS